MPTPTSANNLASRQKIPKGAINISIITIFIITAFKSLKKLIILCPCSPAFVTAKPNKRANTIICKVAPLAMDSTGLLGNILISVCLRGGASLATNSEASARSIPTPGWTITAVNIAKLIAMAVVTRYKTTVFNATAPILELLPNEETPQIRDTKTRGTTSSFRERTNI